MRMSDIMRKAEDVSALVVVVALDGLPPADAT
jgi:hypothetical protein